MLCAGGIYGEESSAVSTLTTCLMTFSQGDNGGPLTVDVDGQPVLVGATSLGQPDFCRQVVK